VCEHPIDRSSGSARDRRADPATTGGPDRVRRNLECKRINYA
jgi:hypothetical protein